MRVAAVSVALALAGCVQPMPRGEVQTAFAQALSVCEVMGNPGKYLGQTLLIRGYYTSNSHYSWITDDPCPDQGYLLSGDPDHPGDSRAEHVLKSVRDRDPDRTRIATVFRAQLAERQREPEGTICAGDFCDRYSFKAAQLVAVDPERRMTRGPSALK